MSETQQKKRIVVRVRKQSDNGLPLIAIDGDVPEEDFEKVLKIKTPYSFTHMKFDNTTSRATIPTTEMFSYRRLRDKIIEVLGSKYEVQDLSN